jgi:tetratricopeptide (TPR) repeat protein
MQRRFLAVLSFIILIFSGCVSTGRAYENSLAAVPFFERGLTLLDQQEYESAIADFTEAIRLDHNNVDAYDRRGYAHENNWDYNRAIADYTQTIRLDPNDVYAYDFRGLAYISKSDRARALADWSKVLEIAPDDTYARDMLEKYK